jgi:hypothetical protein
MIIEGLHRIQLSPATTWYFTFLYVIFCPGGAKNDIQMGEPLGEPQLCLDTLALGKHAAFFARAQ